MRSWQENPRPPIIPPHITLPPQVAESPVRKPIRQPQVVATQGANRTKRSLPNLSQLPEEVPPKRLKKLQAEVVHETPASREIFWSVEV